VKIIACAEKDRTTAKVKQESIKTKKMEKEKTKRDASKLPSAESMDIETLRKIRTRLNTDIEGAKAKHAHQMDTKENVEPRSSSKLVSNYKKMDYPAQEANR